MNVPKFMQKTGSPFLGQGSGTLKSMTCTVLYSKGRKPGLGGFGELADKRVAKCQNWPGPCRANKFQCQLTIGLILILIPYSSHDQALALDDGAIYGIDL